MQKFDTKLFVNVIHKPYVFTQSDKNSENSMKILKLSGGSPIHLGICPERPASLVHLSEKKMDLTQCSPTQRSLHLAPVVRSVSVQVNALCVPSAMQRSLPCAGTPRTTPPTCPGPQGLN